MPAFTMETFRRHLRLVEAAASGSAEQRYYEQFSRALFGIHVANGIARQQRETDHLIRQAREAGGEETARCLETASAALEDAMEALKK